MTKKKSSESAGPDTPQLPVAEAQPKPRVTHQTTAGGLTIIGEPPAAQEPEETDHA